MDLPAAPLIAFGVTFILIGLIGAVAAWMFNSSQVLATAILDRLLRYATTLNIKGESCRLKEKRKAGLLSSAPGPKEVTPTTN